PDLLPHAGTVTREAAFGGYHDVSVRPAAAGVQHLANQVLADERAVTVGRVDEVDAQLRQPSQYAPRLDRVFRVAPYSLANDAHGAEPEAADGAATGELERTAGSGTRVVA